MLLDGDRGSAPAEPRDWSPAPEPPLAQRALASAAERLRLGRSAGAMALRSVVNPGVVGEAFAALRQISSGLGSIASVAPRTALNDAIGARRSVAFAELSLAAAKDLSRRRGATVNDVILTTAALALGRYLRRAGECHPWLRTLVPGQHAPGRSRR